MDAVEMEFVGSHTCGDLGGGGQAERQGLREGRTGQAQD